MEVEVDPNTANRQVYCEQNQTQTSPLEGAVTFEDSSVNEKGGKQNNCEKVANLMRLIVPVINRLSLDRTN